MYIRIYAYPYDRVNAGACLRQSVTSHHSRRQCGIPDTNGPVETQRPFPCARDTRRSARGERVIVVVATRQPPDSALTYPVGLTDRPNRHSESLTARRELSRGENRPKCGENRRDSGLSRGENRLYY
jgi:hypothetical protein